MVLPVRTPPKGYAHTQRSALPPQANLEVGAGLSQETFQTGWISVREPVGAVRDPIAGRSRARRDRSEPFRSGQKGRLRETLDIFPPRSPDGEAGECVPPDPSDDAASPFPACVPPHPHVAVGRSPRLRRGRPSAQPEYDRSGRDPVRSALRSRVRIVAYKERTDDKAAWRRGGINCRRGRPGPIR